MDGGRTRFICAVTATCTILASGCGQAGTAEDQNGPAPSPETTDQTAQVQPSLGGVQAGTGGDDVLRAGAGAQILRGLGGDDEIRGGEGRDRLSGGPGDDLIDAQDKGSDGKAGRDYIFCGPGRDEVLMDAGDKERPEDCEMAGVGIS